MIITRTPFRVSFVGGGSDLESFYHKSPGAVLSTTINKFMYISSHYFFDEDKVRAKYSKTETVKNVNDLKHPIIREILKKFNVKGALELSSNGDVPAGTGLGSSSSFTVGLLHNMYTAFGKSVTKKKLAEEACEIEIEKLKEPIGKQDQYAAAFGGLNVIRFDPSGIVTVEPVHLKKETYEALQKNLIMFYTGGQRKTAKILCEMKKNIEDKKFESTKKMVELVRETRDALHDDDIEGFGEILHKNWVLKRQLASKISNRRIDLLYNKGIKNGAIGGKLLGAGGGGFLLFCCDEKNQEKLREAMQPLKELKFKLENEGSKLIYVEDDVMKEAAK